MKIKTSIFYSLAAVSLLGGVANAQNSATDPVGFHTITVYGATGGPRFSLIAPGLVNPIEYASGTTSINATTVTVEGTPFAGFDYGLVLAGVDGQGSPIPAHLAYYVEVTSGAEAGAWANITANTDNTLTVDKDLSAGGAEKIAIRKHVTVADLFGAGNEAGLDPGDSPAVADEISLFANGVSQVFFYDDTPTFEGYYDAAFNRRDLTPIEPQQAVYVQRKVAGDVNFTRAGHVKVGPTKLQVNTGFNAMANPRAVGVDDNTNPVFTLGASNLFDPGDTANSVDPGDAPNIADEVLIPQPNGSFGVYFFDTTPNPDNGGQPFGWIDAAFADRNNVVIENGTGFLLNRKPNLTGTPFIWTVPAEPIAAP